MSTARLEPRGRGIIGLVGMLLTVGGALAAFPLSEAAWFTVSRGAPLDVSGRAVSHGLSASLPTAALAAVFVMLVFGPPGRRLLGLVVATLGLAMAAASALALPPGGDEVGLGPDPVGAPARAGGSGWYLLTGLLVLLGGLLVAWRPGRARAERGRHEDAWVVLDRGEDPTVG